MSVDKVLKLIQDESVGSWTCASPTCAACSTT